MDAGPPAVGRSDTLTSLGEFNLPEDDLATLLEHAESGSPGDYSNVMNEDESGGGELIALPDIGHADGVVPMSDLRIQITNHTIHRKDHPGTEKETYVVSKDRWFQLHLSLVNRLGQLAVENTLQVDVTLIYENGNQVPLAGSDARLLESASQSLTMTFINGTGHFKLKMGASILSHNHGEQKFMLRVEPSDPTLRHDYSELIVHTAPLKSVTKLYRKKSVGGGGGGNGGGGSSIIPSGPSNEELQSQLDEEKVERAILATQVQQLTDEMQSERRQREMLEGTLHAQQRMLDALSHQLSKLTSSDQPAAALPASSAGMPAPLPRAPSAPDAAARVALLPKSLRSRSPKPGDDVPNRQISR